MRNNLSQPGIGHVIMFGAAAVGWMLLFLITLASAAPGVVGWVKVIFSGVFMIASAVGTVLLLRRVQRAKKAGDQG